MPRGWKKNQSKFNVGRKSGRGGSSNRQHRQKVNNQKETLSSHNHGGKKKKKPLIDISDEFIYEEDNQVDDLSICVPISNTNKQQEKENNNNNKKKNVGECSICCEVRPLVSLLKKCNHDPSCAECLREIYINQAQQNVSNYPLQCFHPECKRPVRETQLIHHNLLQSEMELMKHFRFTVLSKAYKSTKKVVYCPECDFPKRVNKEEVVNCRHCRTTYAVEHDNITTKASTIAAIEAMGNDKFGINDGFATCPQCKMTISKGTDCDHMICFCGMDFSWEGALRQKSISRDYKVIKKSAKIEKI